MTESNLFSFRWSHWIPESLLRVYCLVNTGDPGLELQCSGPQSSTFAVLGPWYEGSTTVRNRKVYILFYKLNYFLKSSLCWKVEIPLTWREQAVALLNLDCLCHKKWIYRCISLSSCNNHLLRSYCVPLWGNCKNKEGQISSHDVHEGVSHKHKWL